MSILVDQSSRVLVQGITGFQGEFHTARMLEFGTTVVAGVTHGGVTEADKRGVPARVTPEVRSVLEACLGGQSGHHGAGEQQSEYRAVRHFSVTK